MSITIDDWAPVWWGVPRSHESGIAIIVGGGPSVLMQNASWVDKKEERERRLPLGRASVCIAVNRSYRSFPKSEYLFYMDHDFFEFEGEERLRQFGGCIISNGYILGGQHCPPTSGIVHTVMRGDEYGVSDDPFRINHGYNSGVGAINLAYLLGCRDIVLLGFDCSDDNQGRRWHYDEPYPGFQQPFYYEHLEYYLRIFHSVAEALRERGIRVWNASPESRIPWWPRMSLEECICQLK